MIPSLPLETAIGVIEIWSGSLANIPTGWSLCDGTNATPDMRDQFALSAGPVFPPGDTDDLATHSHPFTGDAHNHTIPTFFTPIAAAPQLDADTTTNPATGDTDNQRQLQPYYSLAYVMYTGPP